MRGASSGRFSKVCDDHEADVMKRLRDEGQGALISGLVKTQSDPFLRARVRARIETHRRPRRRLRPIGVLLIVVAFGSLASAALAIRVYRKYSAPIAPAPLLASAAPFLAVTTQATA